MSNNAAVTADGGEIGRAQALQARAAGVEPLTDMNPVLLKPETETGAQVVVQGRRVASVRARDYAALKPRADGAGAGELPSGSAQGRDLVLVEGAGSPAEVNLRANDIANMGFARAAGVPVVIAGRHRPGRGDRAAGGDAGGAGPGGPCDDPRLCGQQVPRGSPALRRRLCRRSRRGRGGAASGVVPWFEEAWRLPAEDALDLRGTRAGGRSRSRCRCCGGSPTSTTSTR